MYESKVKPIAWMATSNSHGPQFTADAQMGEHGWKAIGTCYVTRLYSESAIIELKAKLAEAVAKCAVMDAVLLDTCTADTKVKACEAATDAYDLTDKEALAKIKADAIREAAKYTCSDYWMVTNEQELNIYADKLEAGTL